jgi:opacity protein-like surface antigen
VVGAAGFEPATLWSQTRCATRLRYAPCRVAVEFRAPDCKDLRHRRVSNSIGYNIADRLTDSFSSSETRTGWTAGAGIEMALFNSDRLRLKAEYLYTDLGGGEFFRDGTGAFGSTLLGSNGITAASSADLTFHTVRVGVNFAF